MNIILIGFMGSGKTTIGRKLARRLGYRFLDIDQQIETEQDCSIKRIFEYAGENFFRELETQLLIRLQTVKNTIISTGGGVVTVEENLELLKKIGTVVYLQATIDEIWLRVQHDENRPLLQTADPLETIRTLFQNREKMYLQADVIVNTGQSSPQYTVTQIIQNL